MKIIWLTLLLVTLAAGCTSSDKKSSANQEITNTEPAATIKELTIDADGQRMSGLIYMATGNGPHPTIALLHGYPGNEKNLDLAQSLRRSGWNVLFFHYRGAWGSEGEFSFKGAEQDVQTVIKFLQTPAHQRLYRVDASRLSLVGHSMGGHMAIAGMLDNQDISCSVALDGANMGVNSGQGLFKDPRVGKVWTDYSDTLFMLNGWSGQKALAEMEQYGAELDLIPRAKQAGNRPVLLLAADTDVIPMEVHITPLLQSLQAVPNNRATMKVIKDDHSFSNTRLEMIDTVTSFLEKNCR